jgi:hypothetical protein
MEKCITPQNADKYMRQFVAELQSRLNTEFQQIVPVRVSVHSNQPYLVEWRIQVYSEMFHLWANLNAPDGEQQFGWEKAGVVWG